MKLKKNCMGTSFYASEMGRFTPTYHSILVKNTTDGRITIIVSLWNNKGATATTKMVLSLAFLGRQKLLRNESHSKCGSGVHVFALVFLAFINK